MPKMKKNPSAKTLQPKANAAYYAAQKADENFNKALKKQFGADYARYRYEGSIHFNRETMKAFNRFTRAKKTLMAYWSRLRAQYNFLS